MDISVEISKIDLRYQHCRLSHGPSEKRLIDSILEQGIRDPLVGVLSEGVAILLDGFKRFRCARKLSIGQLPFRSLGSDEAAAIIVLMRRANAQSLNFLEQACLIDELRRVHRLSVGEIARRLERSSAWVSIRQGVTSELTPLVSEKIMSGAFPMHAYLASVRPITRVNKSSPSDIESFVRATAGQRLGVRDLDVLARGYFCGGDKFRRQVETGDIGLCLKSLRAPPVLAAANESERRILTDLDLVQRRMRRLPSELGAMKSRNPAFLAEAHLYSGGVRRFVQPFVKAVEEFYDRTRPQGSCRDHASQGHEQEGDSQSARD